MVSFICLSKFHFHFVLASIDWSSKLNLIFTCLKTCGQLMKFAKIDCYFLLLDLINDCICGIRVCIFYSSKEIISSLTFSGILRMDYVNGSKKHTFWRKLIILFFYLAPAVDVSNLAPAVSGSVHINDAQDLPSDVHVSNFVFCTCNWNNASRMLTDKCYFSCLVSILSVSCELNFHHMYIFEVDFN